MSTTKLIQYQSGYGSGRGDETSCGVRLNSLILIHKLKGEVFWSAAPRLG